MNEARAPVDVAIVGGGLVGSGLALMLASQGRRIALIEAQPPRFAEPVWDERCIGLNAASRRILDAIGIWDRLTPDATPILATHISERGRFGVARFTAEQAGLPALGYNTPLRAINESLWSAALQSPPIELLCPASMQGVQVGDDRVEIRLDGKSVNARLLVAADGANSTVRRLLGIASQTRDYEQSAIVSAIRTSRAHKGVAYERFLSGGPLAVLPKPGDACSLVWTVPRAQAQALLELPDADFLAQAQTQFGERLGRFLHLGRRQAHPLSRSMSEYLTHPRTIFVGNAAQSLHPVAAQGFNLGLRDAATVAELLEQAPDPGAGELLLEYARRREQDRARVSAFTDALVRLFSNTVPGLRGLRHLGLFALELDSPAREAVLRQNLGFGGRVPRLATRSA